MNILRFAVKHSVVVVICIALLVLLGMLLLFALHKNLSSEGALPTLCVSTQWPNASPEEIEAKVTDPIERAVSSAPNVYQVSSSSIEGSSMVRVQFREGTNIEQSAANILRLVRQARRAFPTNPGPQDSVVNKWDPFQSPILILSISGEEDPEKLRKLLDKQVIPTLNSVSGVASVTVIGGRQRALIVDVDRNRALAYGVSLQTVVKRIAEGNGDLTTGVLQQNDTAHPLRNLERLKGPEELTKIPLQTASGVNLRLGEIAMVSDSYQEPKVYARVNNQPAIGIVITKQSGADTVITTQAILDQLDRTRKLYPTLQLDVVCNSMAQTDSGDFQIDVKVPIGASLEETSEEMGKIERIVMSDPSVQVVFAAVGSNRRTHGESSMARPCQGWIAIGLKKDRRKSTFDVISDIRKELSEVPRAKRLIRILGHIYVLDPPRPTTQFQIISGTQNVEVDVFGDDLGTLTRISQEVTGRMRNIPGLLDIDVNGQEVGRADWQVDRRKAQNLGVTSSDIADTISASTNGIIAGYYQENGTQYPIVVQLDHHRQRIDDTNLVVNSGGAGRGHGYIIPLSQVAHPVYSTELDEITRINRQRYIAVTGVSQGRSVGRVQADIQQVMKGVRMPQGFHWDWGTDAKR